MHPTTIHTSASGVFKPGMLTFGNKKQTILTINNKGSLIPLYLVPSLGLKPGEYTKLAERCDAEQPMYAFQYQLDEYKAESSDLIREIAAHFVKAVLQSRPEGPVAICAWSAGTIVALEVAQQLKALGRDVALLVAIDWAPENTGVADAATSMVLNLRCWIRDEWQSQQAFRSVGRYLLEKYIDMVKRKIFRGMGAEINLPPTVQIVTNANPGLTQKERAFILRFYLALCDYIPQEYGGNVLAFVATYELHKKIGEKWKAIAPRLKTIDVKGTHNTIVRGADVEPLAAHLWKELAALSRDHS
jgi:thioesterase domain-containing protein